MATPDPLLRAYELRIKQVRAQVVAFVEAAWRALSSWRDGDIDLFVSQVVPVVVGGQQQIAALTTAYLAQQRATALGVPFRPFPVRPADVVGAAVRNGTQPDEVYRRAGVQVWRDLADGRTLDEAVDHGLFRATQAAETDLQLSKTHTSRAALHADAAVTGFERVLTGTENCGLCVIASTQRYFKEDLLPLHPSCDCAVRALYGDDALSQVLNRDLLEAAHDAIAERFGAVDRGGRTPDYRKLLLVQEHGELGPVLTVAKHAFTKREAASSGLDLRGVKAR